MTAPNTAPVHQPRERAVPCRQCSQPTTNVHATCLSCHMDRDRLISRGTCSRCFLDSVASVWPGESFGGIDTAVCARDIYLELNRISWGMK